MIKMFLPLALLLAVGVCGFADENPSQLLNSVLMGIPGRSAIWTETYTPFYDRAREYPFFSPAIVRIGDSEEYRIVQSTLLLRDFDAYSGSFFFFVLSANDALPVEVLPASGVHVTYTDNVPARFPPEVVEDRIQNAGTLLREYVSLQRQVHGAPLLIGTLLSVGLLSGAGCVWILSNESAPRGLKSYGVFLGISAPVVLLLAIEVILSNSSHSRRMEQVGQDLHSLWQ
jgi:hypothetical protein